MKNVAKIGCLRSYYLKIKSSVCVIYCLLVESNCQKGAYFSTIDTTDVIQSLIQSRNLDRSATAVQTCNT